MATKAADQISIVDITDAYSVFMTSEAYSFAGGTTYANQGSCATQITALHGNTSVLVTVGTCTCPTGITASVTNNGTASPTITFTVAANSFTGDEQVTEATIPLTINSEVQFTKKFSFSVSKTGAQGGKGDTGATGKGVSSVTVTYGQSTSNTTPPTCNDTTPPAVDAGKYLWTKFVFNYTDGTKSDATYTVAKQGSTGSAGASSKWYSGTAITGTSTTATVFSGSGITAAIVGDMYLNTSTYNTYRCTTAGAASAAKWVYVNNIKGQKGDTGATGAAAITVAITSSMGTIFKNAAIATTLTAHVYQGGVEKTGSDLTALGTIKWYKDGGTTAVATGATLTITAGDVTNKATYTAQLEG